MLPFLIAFSYFWTLGCWRFQVIFFWTFAGTLLFHIIGWGCPLNAAAASSHEKLLHRYRPWFKTLPTISSPPGKRVAMCSFTSFTAPALATDCIRTFHFSDNQTFHLSDHWLEKEGIDVDVACYHVIDVFFLCVCSALFSKHSFTIWCSFC